MEILKDYRVHLLALIVVLVCEFIGKQTIWVVTLYPMLYAMIVGGAISLPKLKILKEKKHAQCECSYDRYINVTDRQTWCGGWS